jgi:8-oxo-dGTP pyrophosphatase MutT (NUDIX family)
VAGGAADAQRAAFDARVAEIMALAADDGFAEAGALADQHQAWRGEASRLRAERALRFWEAGELSLTQFAAHLGLTKQRAEQILRRARELAAEQSLVPEPQPVVAAIVTSRKGVLITKRRDGKPPWGFPAGEIEPGESPADAAVREVKEETGLLVRHGQPLGRRVHPATGRTMIYMAAATVHGKTDVFVGDEDELEEVRWASLADAEQLLPGMFPDVRAYLGRSIR